MAGSISDGLVMIKTIDDTKIYLTKYDITDKFIESVIPRIIETCNHKNLFANIPNAASVSFWNVDDSGKKVYDWLEMKDFLTFIKPHIRTYIKELNISEDDMMITAMWCNRYKPNTFVIKHNHTYNDYKRGSHNFKTSNDVLGVLLYINKPDNSGNLFIETSDGIEHEFDLKGGDVIIFPSMLQHRTSPNKSKDDKFVIGIEIMMKWVTDENLVGKTLGEL